MIDLDTWERLAAEASADMSGTPPWSVLDKVAPLATALIDAVAELRALRADADQAHRALNVNGVKALDENGVELPLAARVEVLCDWAKQVVTTAAESMVLINADLAKAQRERVAARADVERAKDEIERIRWLSQEVEREFHQMNAADVSMLIERLRSERDAAVAALKVRTP